MPGAGQMPQGGGKIYSATYSHVPVYEYASNGDQIMRRRADDYINATHILKASGFDKPARTRILEREVQKGTHEKIQGGYGRYQGTWIPLHDARGLAERNGVLERLRPIFDYVPGDRSPPPAPKNPTAASSKPRAPRQSAAARRQAPVADHSRMSDATNYAYATRETPDHMSVQSGSPGYPGSGYSASGHHRKRKRDVDEPPPLSYEDAQHMLWTDELLDYFMMQSDPDPTPLRYPEPPPGVDINRVIDEKGHTPMHWAASMGDLHVVADLVARGANVGAQSQNGETPLMRAVIFINNYERSSMEQLGRRLISTADKKDDCQSTVFHHAVAATCTKTSGKYSCARYYLETILGRMTAQFNSTYIANLLDQQDQNGDTAILIAAKFGARKCVRVLLQYGASTDIPNHLGQTADEEIAALNARRRDRNGVSLGIASSSPVRDLGPGANGVHDLARSLDGSSHRTPTKRARKSYRSEAANMLSSQLPDLIATRTEALAQEFDQELAEQEASVNEGAKALELRVEEIERLRKDVDIASAAAPDGGVENDEVVVTEVNSLEEEVRTLLEAELLDQLDSALDEKNNDTLMNGVAEHDTASLRQQVLDLQNQRSTILDDTVSALSQTGPSGLHLLTSHPQASARTPRLGSSNTDKYLRLIRSTLGLSPEDAVDIEELLPEMLVQLEERRREMEVVAKDEGEMDVSMLDASEVRGQPPSGLGYGFGAVDNGAGGGVVL